MSDAEVRVLLFFLSSALAAFYRTGTSESPIGGRWIVEEYPWLSVVIGVSLVIWVPTLFGNMTIDDGIWWTATFAFGGAPMVLMSMWGRRDG